MPYRELPHTMADASYRRATDKQPQTVTLSPAAVARLLGRITAIFVAGQIGVIAARLAGHPMLLGLVQLFDLDVELNFPSFFSMLLLVSASLISALHLSVERANRGRATFGWGLLTAGFLYMALDEGFSFHERLTVPLQLYLGSTATGMLRTTWVIVGIPVVLLAGLSLLPFLRSLDARTLRRYLVAGAVYLGGAIVVEMFEGRWEEKHHQDTVYAIFVLFEETGEMTGVVLFIWASLDHLRERVGQLRLNFEPQAARVAAGRVGSEATATDISPELELDLLTYGGGGRSSQTAAATAAGSADRTDVSQSEVA